MNAKTKENKILMEAKKMLNRISFFEIIYDYSDEFKSEAKKLTKLVDDYENGKVEDIDDITNAFGNFTKKYTKYIAGLAG